MLQVKFTQKNVIGIIGMNNPHMTVVFLKTKTKQNSHNFVIHSSSDIVGLAAFNTIWAQKYGNITVKMCVTVYILHVQMLFLHDKFHTILINKFVYLNLK